MPSEPRRAGPSAGHRTRRPAARTGPGDPVPVPAAGRGPDAGAGRTGAPGTEGLPAALLRRRPGTAAAVLLCGLGAALAALALPAALGTTVDRVLAGGPVPWEWIALCAALTAAEVLLDAAVALLGGVNSARLTRWLRDLALHRVLRTEPRRAAALTTGDLTTRLTATTTAAAGAPVAAASTATAVLLPVGGLVGILLTDAWTAVALLAGIPPLILLLRAFTRHTTAATADYQRTQAVVATRLSEAVDGAATVRAAGTARHEHARITAPLAELDTHGRRTWQVYGRAVGRSSVLLPLLTTLVLAVAGLRLGAGALTVGELVTVTRYAALTVGIGAVTGALGALARSRAAGERLRPVLELPALPHRSAVPPPDGPGTLELHGVDVVREGAHVLRDVRLRVPGGTSMAVVGRSGSGKSTLAAVAGRLTDPDAGTVALDGVPLAEIDPVLLRREVGYAFARPALFGATVADALAFGAERPSAQAVRAAARDAAADPFVQLLPHGYDTPLPDAPLSGGERQRLGLARAFAHPGRLLVLDDATSGLDTATERRVQHALDRQAGTRTRLIVAHRLSSAARADRVVWLEDGAVRAVGRHTDLWHDPAYRQIFQPSDPTGDRKHRHHAEPANPADGQAAGHTDNAAVPAEGRDTEPSGPIADRTDEHRIEPSEPTGVRTTAVATPAEKHTAEPADSARSPTADRADAHTTAPPEPTDGHRTEPAERTGGPTAVSAPGLPRPAAEPGHCPNARAADGRRGPPAPGRHGTDGDAVARDGRAAR